MPAAFEQRIELPPKANWAVSATDRRVCPVCNTLFPDSSGSCPVCALHAALKSDAAPSSPTKGGSADLYAWTNQLDLAFEILIPMAKTPGDICYGLLKSDPFWDPLRKDPRFGKLLAELAPKD
jgi:hypothetical protein